MFSGRVSIVGRTLLRNSQKSVVSTAQSGPWEADLSDFLRASETWDQDNDRDKAQEFANRLDKV